MCLIWQKGERIVNQCSDNDDSKSDTDEPLGKKDKKLQLTSKFYCCRKPSNNEKLKTLITAYDFGNILNKSRGDAFLKFVQKQPYTSDIFDLDPIQTYLNAQWQEFKGKYFFLVFLYITQMFCLFFYYYFMLKLVRSQAYEDSIGNQYILPITVYVLFTVTMLINLYFHSLDKGNMKYSHKLSQKWIIWFHVFNMIMMCIDMVLVLFERDFTKYSEQSLSLYRPVLIGIDSMTLLCCFIVFFIKIKQLNIMKFYITRIYLVFLDVRWLLVIGLAIQFGFCLAYILISQLKNAYDEASFHEEYFSLADPVMAASHFYEDPFSDLISQYGVIERRLLTHAQIFYIYCYACLMLFAVGVNLFLSYFMIGAIAESYKKVSQNLHRQKYKALAEIIYQNTSYFQRHSAYKNIRFIIKAEEESAKTTAQRQTIKTVRKWGPLVDLITKEVSMYYMKESGKIEGSLNDIRSKIESVVLHLEENEKRSQKNE